MREGEIIMKLERDALLKQITILDFMALDLHLYLNTHPSDEEALTMYNDCITSGKVAREKYEMHYGPLTAFRSDGQKNWNWIDCPWPWHTDFNFSLEE